MKICNDSLIKAQLQNVVFNSRTLQIIDLPKNVVELLDQLDAPKRLNKHLQIVYSTAADILKRIHHEWPDLNINQELVLFGAATHDIGKTKIKSELFESGKRHELVGRDILKELGYSDQWSRFALTHGNWKDDQLTMEDLLVVVADKIWKGKRVEDLEERLGQLMAEDLAMDYWEIYQTLDALLSEITLGADQRINWQGE